jgi:hypothetical protein
MDFPTFITTLAASLDNQNARVLPFLIDSTVRQLAELAVERTLFMEGTFTMPTVAGQSEYPLLPLGSGAGQNPATYTAGTNAWTGGPPPDFLDADLLYVNLSAPLAGRGIPIRGPVPISELRTNWPVLWTTGVYPTAWGFHHGAIILGPIPPNGVTVYGDYLRDSTRADGSSGAAAGQPITTAMGVAPAGTGVTNPWFSQGYHVLRARVLADFHASISKDEQQLTFQSGIAASGLQTLTERWVLAKGAAHQAARWPQPAASLRFGWGGGGGPA